METENLQQLVEEVSLQHFDRPFNHKATFNKRLKTTGGRYHLQTHDLDFNPKVLEKAGETAFIGVIKHELCHYHLHLSGHGYQHKDKAFKQLLQKVGGLRYTPSLIEKSEQKRLLKY
ncbi:MAG: SprT family protein, partial [Tetragenococcus halophilus]|nr:SprT family protein [Tetragenococcus halophilus]